ncbi:hypothetical protein GCM10010317_094220 [Streptomyces mirabilis]|nr:hypothetical protein GCM10010317_094220 [Streptomyces mirabilis]
MSRQIGYCPIGLLAACATGSGESTSSEWKREVERGHSRMAGADHQRTPAQVKTPIECLFHASCAVGNQAVVQAAQLVVATAGPQGQRARLSGSLLRHRH